MFHLDSSNRLATIHRYRQTGRETGEDRQRSESIGRTISQIVAEKVQQELHKNNVSSNMTMTTFWINVDLFQLKTSNLASKRLPIMAYTAAIFIYKMLTFSCCFWSSVQQMKLDDLTVFKEHVKQCTSCIHCVSKKRPTFTTCYNFYIHSSIATIFGTNVAQKVGNQNVLYFPTKPN